MKIFQLARPGAMLGAVLSASLLSACATTQPDAFVPPESARKMAGPEQAERLKARYADAPSCTRFQNYYDEAGWPKGDSLEVVKEIDARVRDRFVYRREAVDDWNARVDVMLLSEYDWIGDCDDLSATVVALSRCAGVPEDRLGLFLMKANGADTINHMIGFFIDNDGRSYALGDTFGEVRPMLHNNQEPFAWTFLKDLSLWNLLDDKEDLTAPPTVQVAQGQEVRE
jgi:hypothetical protein